MARADLLVRLVEVASRGDGDAVRRTVEQLAEEERRKQHHVLADRLLGASRSTPGRRHLNGAPRRTENELLEERAPNRALGSLRLSPEVEDAVREVIEEQERAALLRSHGLEPRHRILLVGPPGNGKTSLAEAIAGELGWSLVTPAYHRVIGSLLGETAGRLAKVFEYVASRACVLFLDEIDVVAKERGDAQETGEIKRVVSSLLLNIDRLPPHVLVIGASNHAALLDRAVWRRFQLRLTLPPPGPDVRAQYLGEASRDSRIPWGVSAERMAEELGTMSFSDLEQFVDDIRRRLILEQPKSGRTIVQRSLRRWQARAGPTSEVE